MNSHIEEYAVTLKNSRGIYRKTRLDRFQGLERMVRKTSNPDNASHLREFAEKKSPLTRSLMR